MKNSLVSIILPTFNRAEFLPRALDSVLAQSYGNWECLVIDDGSTDGTDAVLARYTDPRITSFRQENQGVSGARNAGIARCRGDVMALLDSDDEWMERKLEAQLGYMADKGFEISQTEEIWVRNGKRVNQPARYARPEGWFFDASLEMCLISPSCTMFTRRAWEVMGPFDTAMPSCEDYDMWLRACLHFPVGLVREPLTVKHGGRADQLSVCVPCADLHRIRALVKILQSRKLDDGQRESALDALRRKVEIYMQGCEKRDKKEEADRVWTLFCMVRDGKEIPLNTLS
ncbi:MAG: glycosyltransferase family 2 protein [Pseudodesulfovibrio sp.]|jgi:glycosyltransferase involved in cell wall biosynthesis|uniref:Glycosyl transferase n=1 Tax=Pseudodesulfovibrio indicus TaxID=1716143 RepID=A0A126QN84_9BACT|nr:glycosyltransferase [Pseudodesulfovibrio indicus]AMK11550.1 glycosyl transferase [Pseudodesulfovibrio indicus]TDT89954.1 glycosyl transferase family 2 [Pseudodesulfovibrio indicus]